MAESLIQWWSRPRVASNCTEVVKATAVRRPEGVRKKQVTRQPRPGRTGTYSGPSRTSGVASGSLRWSVTLHLTGVKSRAPMNAGRRAGAAKGSSAVFSTLLKTMKTLLRG